MSKQAGKDLLRNIQNEGKKPSLKRSENYGQNYGFEPSKIILFQKISLRLDAGSILCIILIAR